MKELKNLGVMFSSEGKNEARDWPENRSSGSGIAVALSHHCGKESAEPEGKPLNLPVYPFSYSYTYGNEG